VPRIVALVITCAGAIVHVLTRAIHGAEITAWGHACIHASPSSFSKIVPYFFLISTCEELKHVKNIF